MFSLMLPKTIFYLTAYWEITVNSQLTELTVTRCFRFPSLVTYLFLYTHVDRFIHLGLNIMDIHKNKPSMVY